MPPSLGGPAVCVGAFQQPRSLFRMTVSSEKDIYQDSGDRHSDSSPGTSSVTLEKSPHLFIKRRETDPPVSWAGSEAQRREHRGKALQNSQTNKENIIMLDVNLKVPNVCPKCFSDLGLEGVSSHWWSEQRLSRQEPGDFLGPVFPSLRPVPGLLRKSAWQLP